MVKTGDLAIVEKLRGTLAGPLSRLDLESLGRHNRAYTRRYATGRFEHFVVAEWPYYRAVLDWYRAHIAKGATVLDVGMFIPVMPLLLSWEGYRVTCIEKLALYGPALSEMVSLVQEHHVNFIDADILADSAPLSAYDAINLLCVVEHLLGSPKDLLVHLRARLKPGGQLLFAVPNQARLVRRLGLMFGGISVQPEFAEYFESSYPFAGHNREYTMREVLYALEHSGWRAIHAGSVRYPPEGSRAKRLITAVGNWLPPTFHQVLFAVATRN